MTTEATTTDLQVFIESWQDWHRAQEARISAPHGFLAITGLHWLDDRPQRFPDAPGAWRTGPDGVVVALDDGEELVVDGTPVRGERSVISHLSSANHSVSRANASVPIRTRRAVPSL
ncbi:hypothetical protein ACWCQR_09400, partial [Streptomyces sp. NPDC002172]